MVLFTMAGELETVPELPPIISNGREVYPLPAPWLYEPPLKVGGQKIDTREVLETVNEWLPHVKKNATAYNEALAVNDRPTAERIAVQSVKDSAEVWSTCNAVAESVETESVYSAFLLSSETEEGLLPDQLRSLRECDARQRIARRSRS